jgi:hypothetical protein
MDKTIPLAEVVALALKLAPKERLQLIEQVAASVERENGTPPSSNEHWGQNLLRLLDEMEPVELIHPEIEDPVEWVKQIRREQEQKRNIDWEDRK